MMKKIFLFALLSILLASLVSAQQLKKVGQSCSVTADCAEGYCNNASVCVFATEATDKELVSKNAVSSAQCVEGYADSSECVLPLAGPQPFTLGVKSGCAGILANIRGGNVLTCYFVWILLLATSGLSAYISRNAQNRLIPIGLFLIPILVGGITYPYIGVIIAVMEIIIFLSRGKKPSEPAAPAPKKPTFDRGPVKVETQIRPR
ncbi:Uncharacterised protein [Candidatus Gugararchaeum adminiculabundum]|nr:Uncharacterised protein [Candidatus Gugararchaeum adminiculabundum]